MAKKFSASNFLFHSHTSILSKFMTLIMLTVISSHILSSMALSINEWFVFRNMGTSSLSTLAGVIANNSTAALAFKDKKVGAEILSALTSEPQVVLGCLYTEDSQLFTSYVTSKSAKNCPVHPPPTGVNFKDQSLSISQSISEGSEKFGSLFLLSDMHAFRQRLEFSAVLLASITLTAVLLAYLIASRLQHNVTGPVLQLAETAKFISNEGKYNLRAKKTSETEVNILVDSFNRMLDAIQERETKIVESEEMFRASFDRAPVGEVLVNESGQFIKVNSAFCRLLEYQDHELVKMNITSITPPEDREKSYKALDGVFKKVLPTYSYEKRYLTKSQKPVWVLVSGAPILDQNGKVSMAIAVIQDLSERKRAEEQRDKLFLQEKEARIEAEKSIQARDDFLSIASHELRTPITPMKTHLQMLKEELESVPPEVLPQIKNLIKGFEISERQIKNLEILTEDLLNVSRITAGRLSLNFKTLNLTETVRDVLERNHAEIKRFGSEVHFNAKDKVLANYDLPRMEQIITNLLTNALKYGLKNPIDISVIGTETKAILIVRDHGIGIAKEDQNKIFQRFERVSSIKHFPGLGLGLYITNELVLAHHGQISVESQIGQGSTFKVELPISPSIS